MEFFSGVLEWGGFKFWTGKLLSKTPLHRIQNYMSKEQVKFVYSMSWSLGADY